MKIIFFCLLWLVGSLAAVATESGNNLISNPALVAAKDNRPEGWTLWSPRPGLAPTAGLSSRDGVLALELRARSFPEYGRWTSVVRDITPGKFYRFEAWYQASGVETETVSVVALLTWCRKPDGTEEIQRDYIDPGATTGGWRQNVRTLRAPDGVQSVRVELGLRWTQQGTVWWKDISLAEAPPPAPRMVRVATTQIVPGPVRTMKNNTELMVQMFERVAVEKPDVLLFSECLSNRGTRLSLEDKSETIPGPLTATLGELARKHHCYVVTALHERDGDLYYNTAVLIDRAGQVVGRYRKVHLAMSEADVGLTPGGDYPVFDTDFGRIGLLICWDDWFSEPARILRLRGAEILFLPIAGDGSDVHWDASSRARAMDNGLYFVSSGTVSDASRIINPDGQVLAEARGKFAYAVQDLDLNQEWRLRYLSVASGVGEAKSVYLRERRPETYGDLTDGAITPASRPSNRRESPPLAKSEAR